MTRVLTAAEMQGRDLLRRRIALGLLVALPIMFYLAVMQDPEQEPFPFIAGGVGMGWSVAGAGFFAAVASRRTDPRLVLAGYRPVELLLGRLLVLEVLAVAILVVFSGLIELLTPAPKPGLLVLGLGLAAVVGVPLGLAVAALLPRELEGTLAIIGVVGINMSVPPGVTLAPFLPFYGPVETLMAAAGGDGQAATGLAHALAYGAGLFALALLLWTRRVRVRRHEESPRTRHGRDAVPG